MITTSEMSCIKMLEVALVRTPSTLCPPLSLHRSISRCL